MPGVAAKIIGENDAAVTDPTASASVIAALKGIISLLISNRQPQIQLIMPAAWTAADLTFATSATSGGTFTPLYDDNDIETTVNTGVTGIDRSIGIDVLAGVFAGCRYIKIRSGTLGTPVAQGAERIITVLINGIVKTATIANGASLSDVVDLA